MKDSVLQPAMRSRRLAQRHLSALPATGGGISQLLGRPVPMAKRPRSALGASCGPRRRQPEPYGIGPLGRALQVQPRTAQVWHMAEMALQCSCYVRCCPHLWPDPLELQHCHAAQGPYPAITAWVDKLT